MPVKTRRWCDPAEPGDGLRVLVCRYRPRALPKKDETWHRWIKDLGPSKELHANLYGKNGSPISWTEFQKRYLAEMQGQGSLIEELAHEAGQGRTITLLCSSSCTDETHCHRTLLKGLIEDCMARLSRTSEKTAVPQPVAAVEFQDSLLERFCRYVRIDTMADEAYRTVPSTAGQLELGRLLRDELVALGTRDAEQDEHGIVLATLPATVPHQAPAIAFIAHVDTSPETTARGVKPVVHRGYDGGDITLPGDSSKVLRPAENPELARLKGKTIITTDGTTLLGGDDKSGVAVVMETASYLLRHPEIPHGPIRVCFTCDEEIGHGVDHLDLKKLGAVVGYTLDGGSSGELDHETFSADLATVTITGKNVHPGIARGKMINAIRLAGLFLDRLPRTFLSPETTEDRQGFLHPYRIEGGVAEVVLKVLLRDHDTRKLADRKAILDQIASLIEAEYPGSRVDVRVTPQYRNMAEGLVKEPRALAYAQEAMRRAGIEPKLCIVRGGTDGSRLTELGLPTPNIFCGEHNIHSPLEWTCLEEMCDAVRVLIELAQVWGKEQCHD